MVEPVDLLAECVCLGCQVDDSMRDPGTISPRASSKRH